jgi:hypothetical protein
MWTLQTRWPKGTHPIIKPVMYEAPAFMPLAFYLGLASLPLRMERVELKLKIMCSVDFRV